MKKFIVLTLVCAFAFSAGNVFSTPRTASSTTVTAEPDKKPIKKEELPEPVKTTLAGPDFKGWEITEAFSVKEEKAEYYEVNLKNVDKTMTVKLDKDGKKIA